MRVPLVRFVYVCHQSWLMPSFFDCDGDTGRATSGISARIWTWGLSLALGLFTAYFFSSIYVHMLFFHFLLMSEDKIRPKLIMVFSVMSYALV